MDENAFPHQGRKTFELAQKEASRRGSTVVEAEHVVLALLNNPAGVTSTALGPVGLTHDSFDSALDAERSHSLAVAGITTLVIAAPATPRRGRAAFGASIREAITLMRRQGSRERGAGALERELLRSILTAELGTMPRALSLAGIDRGALLTSLHSAQGAK